MNSDAVFVLIAMFASAGFLLTGMRMFFNYRVHRLEAERKAAGAGADQVRQLAETVDAMQEHLIAMRDDLAEIHERMDFAERVLTQGKHGDPPRLP